MFGIDKFKKMHESLDEVQMALRVRPDFTEPEEARAYFDKLQKELDQARGFMEELFATREPPAPANEVRQQKAS